MRAKYARSDLVALQNIIDLIKDCQKTVANSVQRGLLFTKIRQRLHQMEFYAFLTPVLVKKSKVLEENAGLPQIFYDAMGVEYPWDIKDDALLLYQKWMCGIFDPYLLRGITSDRKKHAGGKKSMSHRLDKTYTGRVSCNVVGENGLRNGQWWPMQICAMRDGAHGEIEGGIHGQPEKGAFSIILSGGGYEDRDEGERILYCGTSGTEGKPTAGTNHLKLTHRLGNPLRVLRSASLPSSNPWCPEMGIRYDGLYNVIGFEILDEATAMHRFVLQRRTDQYPIRFQGEEARPTDEEKSQYSNIRELLGVKA
ncbi:MAG: hypothetical protein M1823_004773 [Watsoniomyces obsoletus]|nr:MAG: hypothetical protein M1823_004773 [Watsoniomyces obsoletus]